MYNLAFAQFSNEFDIQDINSAIEQYKKTIEECDRIKLGSSAKWIGGVV
jgi:hypothetical protein